MLTRQTTSFTLTLAATLALISVSAHAQPGSLLGHVVPADSAVRTVHIDADTQSVRVDRFDTVQFVTPEGQFTVRFDGSVNRGSLQALAPAGVLAHDVTVRVLPNGGDEYQ